MPSRRAEVIACGLAAVVCWQQAYELEPRRVCQLWQLVGDRCAVWTSTGSSTLSGLLVGAAILCVAVGAALIARGVMVRK